MCIPLGQLIVIQGAKRSVIYQHEEPGKPYEQINLSKGMMDNQFRGPRTVISESKGYNLRRDLPNH